MVIGHTDCDAPMGLVVHRHSADETLNDEDVRLPIIDDGIVLHERKQGPTSITRHATATVPIEGFGADDWLQYIDAFQEGGRIQQASVLGTSLDRDGKPVGDPVPVFRGYLSAVGSTGGTNRARVRVLDPMKLLGTIEAGVSFAEATVEDVLAYVRERFVAEQAIFNDVDIEIATPNRRVIDALSLSSPDLIRDEAASGAVLAKTFSTNCDTLSDVIRWLREMVPVMVWFGPTQNGSGITLYASERLAAEYDLTPSSTKPPVVIKNGALYEMRPFNALKLKGKTGQDVEVGSFRTSIDIPYADGDYREATAYYPPLVRRHGSRITETATSDLAGVENLKQEAKSRLKSRLDETSGGSMTTTLGTQLRPYDRVTATPACAGVTADVDALTYEVQRATHRMVPNSDELPQSELGVSIAIDPSLIEVGSSTKDAQTGGEPSDGTSPIDGLSWTINGS